MGYFPDAVATALKQAVVRCDLLVYFDFATTPMWLWQGFGTLHTLDDQDWQGIGQLGHIGDLESSIGGTAPQATFTLSGVDPSLLNDALNASDEVFGRDVNVYMQFFDENFACLDNPYVVWAGTMNTLHVKHSVSQCSVELTAETIFARRSLPPLGNLSDRDQRRLYPDDSGCGIIPAMVSRVAIWPVIFPIA